MLSGDLGWISRPGTLASHPCWGSRHGNLAEEPGPVPPPWYRGRASGSGIRAGDPTLAGYAGQRPWPGSPARDKVRGVRPGTSRSQVTACRPEMLAGYYGLGRGPLTPAWDTGLASGPGILNGPRILDHNPAFLHANSSASLSVSLFSFGSSRTIKFVQSHDNNHIHGLDTYQSTKRGPIGRIRRPRAPACVISRGHWRPASC